MRNNHKKKRKKNTHTYVIYFRVVVTNIVELSPNPSRGMEEDTHRHTNET